VAEPGETVGPGSHRPPGAPHPAPYRMRDSHTRLVPALDPVPGTSATCDGVFVLTHRHPGRVVAAHDLAASLSCPLIVLTSSRHRVLVRAALLRRWHEKRRRPTAAYVVDPPWPADQPLPGLTCLGQPGAADPKYRDVSAKRNLAVALARGAGWRWVVIVDDDVRGLTPGQVGRACGALAADPRLAMVSWRLRSFPDNSVVCHARRLVGGPQDVFIGSGAMLLATRAVLPFFPPTYNEDWLFLFDLLREQGVRWAGDVRQLTFDPFRSPSRASQEEFGDLLAEGLFHLLHEGHSPLAAAEPGYWRGVAKERLEMIIGLTGTLQARSAAGPVRGARRYGRAARSLTAATREHRRRDLPAELAAFVRAWRADLVRWQAWFAARPVRGELGPALRDLGLGEFASGRG
jgi:hypothetical protein